MAKITIIILISLIMSVSLFTQEDEAEKELKEVHKITQLYPEHFYLADLAGEWKLMGVNHAGEGGTSLTGNAIATKIMQGHYLQLDMNIEKEGVGMSTRMIFGFDTRTNTFTLYSFDDVTNYSQYSTGKKTGEKLIFNGKDYSLKDRKDVPFRIEILKERENKITIKIYNLGSKKEFLNTEYMLIKKS